MGIGGYFDAYEKNSDVGRSCHLRTRCGGHSCRRSVQALAQLCIEFVVFSISCVID